MNNTNATTVSVEPGQGMPINAIGFWCLILSLEDVVMLALAMVFCASAWNGIPAWQKLMNFIFINMISALTMLNISYIVCFNQWPYCTIPRLHHRFNEMSTSALANWTLIMCMAIYMKILKVYSADLPYRYLLSKSIGFAWGLSILEIIIGLAYFNDPLPAVMCMTHGISYVILGFYLCIGDALLKLAIAGKMVGKDNFIQIIKIFFYVTYACAIVALVQVKEYVRDYHDHVFLAIFILEQIFVILFWSMKTHRDVLEEHREQMQREREAESFVLDN